jgi:aminopeptidase
MKDNSHIKMAKLVLNYSVNIQPGEKVLLIVPVNAIELGRELVREALRLNARPVLEYNDYAVERLYLESYNEANQEQSSLERLEFIKTFQAVIVFRARENDYELAHIPSAVMDHKTKLGSKQSAYIVNQTKWLVLNYPTLTMAHKAKMSFEAFEEYYYKVCLVDYPKLEKKLMPLKELMDKTKKVKIISPTTNLEFSIDGIGSIICAGRRNIPDGEVYTSPVIDSVNGVLEYNVPTTYAGQTFENVRLTFKNGRIVEASAKENSEKLNMILDTDDGARHIGEFAIGVNPIIMEPIGDILFDEKISGSFHFTPGKAYENEADNSNRSAIHWDMVQIQRSDYGGGQIYFDDVLIRDNGKFTIDSLKQIDEL